MTLSSWKNKGVFFDYNSNQIFTIDEGEGEVILLIHGFPTASWDWMQIWTTLVAKYRLITLDLLGFGFSDKPKNYPYSIFDQADLIEQLLAFKQIGTVKIISHDYGNTVAQELLSRYNARHGNQEDKLKIASLCFLNGGLFPETHQALFIQKILMSPLGSLVGQLLNRKKLGKNFKKIFGPNTQPTEAELDDFWKLID